MAFQRLVPESGSGEVMEIWARQMLKFLFDNVQKEIMEIPLEKAMEKDKKLILKNDQIKRNTCLWR